jgi:hypothetical protein
MHYDFDPAAAPPLKTWFLQGLRAGFFLKPRVGREQPRPLQLAILVLLALAIDLALTRFEIAGPANFDMRAWLAPQWATALLLLLGWWMLPSRLASWFALWVIATLPVTVAAVLLGIAQARGALPAVLAEQPMAAWGLYLLLLAWMVVIAVVLASRLGARWRQRIGFGVALLAIVVLNAWQFPDRAWSQDRSQARAEEPETARLELSQETFEAQQALWRKQVEALAPERPGVTDMYALVFAPYADEDVFLRESTMVAGVVAERFDARGRVLHLVNNTATTATHPWATPLNLQRGIEAIAARMDRENDVLLVYMTSHGASNFRLSASHGALEMDTVSPGALREALDKAGIKHRVIAISACFSGGWVAPLADASTLVMTAADATHTSYGCGRLSELTFFGRAVFDEQLRKTHSFEQAFAAAVPLIRQREIDAGKKDGFSNPQISVGEAIRPLLQGLEQRLAAQH